MKLFLGLSESVFWLLPVIAIAILASYFFYYNKFKDESLSDIKKYTLLILRFLLLLLVGFLLLKPIFKSYKENIQKPVIVFAQDNSQSMRLSADSTFILDTLPKLLQSFFEKTELKYDVEKIQFGDTIESYNPDYSGVETNYEQLFNEFNTTFFNQNIGALVLVSDGLFNTAKHPYYLTDKLSFPIYSVGIGDTLPYTDASILKTEFNKITYQGNSFPLRVGVSAKMLKGKSISVNIYKNGELLEQKNIDVLGNQYYKNIEFYLKADSAGHHEYEIKVDSYSSESNRYNNSKKVYVQVKKEKRKVLLVQNGYHPDISVFRTILNEAQSFKVELLDVTKDKLDVKDASLIILHQLPANTQLLQPALAEAKKKNIPLLFILGQKSSISEINSLNSQLSIEQTNSLFDDARPGLSPNFSLFNTTVEQQFLTDLPPLNVPFGDYSVFQPGNVLFYQNIGQIETNKPLWAFAESDNQKFGFILGEGIWKWRMYEYKSYNDHSITNDLVLKTVQYLATNNDNELFVIDVMEEYRAFQPINLKAKVFNASNEFVKNANIEFALYNTKGNTYTHNFKELNDEYTLSLGNLQIGTYNYSATVKYGDKTLKKNGTFIVKENLIENTNLVADYNLLYNLSERSGGKFFTKRHINQLTNIIDNNTAINPVIHYEQHISELFDFKFLLLIIITIMVLEWFLRKYWGLV